MPAQCPFCRGMDLQRQQYEEVVDLTPTGNPIMAIITEWMCRECGGQFQNVLQTSNDPDDSR